MRTPEYLTKREPQPVALRGELAFQGLRGLSCGVAVVAAAVVLQAAAFVGGPAVFVLGTLLGFEVLGLGALLLRE